VPVPAESQEEADALRGTDRERSVRKRQGLRDRRTRSAIIDNVLDGEVTFCFLKTGQSKVVYPTVKQAEKAARRLNRLRSTRYPGEPYECDEGPHWHLRGVRSNNDEESED
jgi:hypothetical protein